MSFGKQVDLCNQHPNRVSSSLHLSEDTSVIPQHSIAAKFICQEEKEAGSRICFFFRHFIWNHTL